MNHIRIRRGHWTSCSDVPDQHVHDLQMPRSAAFVGWDFPRLRPVFDLSKGDAVAAGQIVFRDRAQPRIAFVAPISGTISQIAYGPHRTLSLCSIQRDADAAKPDAGPTPRDLTDTGVRETLLNRGMWPAFRSRPFGHIPDPDARPAAIFVTATQLSPLAPDPHVVIAQQAQAFEYGISMLTSLTDGPVHVCQSKGSALCTETDQIKVTVFDGAMASALAGTHIDRLHAVHPGHQVWTIGYQDVAAIGHVFLSGEYDPHRVVSITGPCARQPKLVRTCLGAHLHDICADVTSGHKGTLPARVMSGDEVTGRVSPFLGRFDQQITLATTPDALRRQSWRSRLFAAHGPMIPTAAVERALAPDILPIPFLRALSVGDTDAARRLGCLALLEEDVAILTRRCTSGADYGVLLRQILDDLAEDVA